MCYLNDITARRLKHMKNYYADPTANTAIARVERELRQQKKREAWLRRKEEQKPLSRKERIIHHKESLS